MKIEHMPKCDEGVEYKDDCLKITVQNQKEAFELGILFERLQSRNRLVWQGDNYIKVALNIRNKDV